MSAYVDSNGVTSLTSNIKTLSDVAYEKKKLVFNNIRVAISSFVSDLTYDDYPYRASIALTNVTDSMYPQVAFNLIDAICGIYAPISETYNGGTYIYANQIPEATSSITIDEVTFLTQVSGSGVLTFTYDSGWDLDLATYGLTITGTPNNGDTIVVTYDTSSSIVDAVLNGSILIPTIICFFS